ncbi:PH domain-containing protein [Streptomyces sp. NPDC018693]|uniref:PH domain-containing protein n=1 Tax=unclassified Streptomyces TaxID=2593676 RepID=UPI0037B39975
MSEEFAGLDREYRKSGRGMPVEFIAVVFMAMLIMATFTHGVIIDATPVEAVLWALPVMAIWGAVVGRMALELWRARTRVTADGITVRGVLRTRHFPWSGVYDLRVEPRRRVRRSTLARWPAYLYTVDGRRVLLPHLDELQHGDPLAEVADLRATAVRLGLTTCGERPEMEARLLRGARRRAAWERAAMGGWLVFTGMCVRQLWLLFSDRPIDPYPLILAVPLVSLAVLFLAFDRLGELLAARRSPGTA